MIAEGPEIIRRLQVVSQMRDFLLEVRRTTAERHARGEHPYPPPYDIRSDPAYWTNRRGNSSTPALRDT